jgi:pimeloyl-ACP methyl ester carboxylesterase
VTELLTLPDGRALEFRVSGAPDGTPLVFHHGTPGCSVQLPRLADACQARGLRLVSYSRAGYGRSDRNPGRRVVDVAGDVAAVLDHLGAGRCLTAGWSGGGPHALASAAALPERVGGALCIAGVAPYGVDGLDFLAGMGEQNIEEFGWAVDGESALREPIERDAAELAGADLDGVISGMQTLLPEADLAVLRDYFGQHMVDLTRGAFTVSADGWIDDDLAFTTPWGFELAELSVPCFLWQGSTDLMVPFAHGQWLAEHVPGATAHLIDGPGHLSVWNHLDAMLDELVATL